MKTIVAFKKLDVGALLFPRADECRRLAALPPGTPGDFMGLSRGAGVADFLG